MLFTTDVGIYRCCCCVGVQLPRQSKLESDQDDPCAARHPSALLQHQERSTTKREGAEELASRRKRHARGLPSNTFRGKSLCLLLHIRDFQGRATQLEIRSEPRPGMASEKGWSGSAASQPQPTVQYCTQELTTLASSVYNVTHESNCGEIGPPVGGRRRYNPGHPTECRTECDMTMQNQKLSFIL